MSTWEAKTQAAVQFRVAAAKNPSATLIAMDFDGTLAPIVEDPEASRMTHAAGEALARLGRYVRLAIITGRSVATVRRLGELDHRPGLERLIVLGQYGAERWDVETGQVTSLTPPERVHEALAELAVELERRSIPGIYLEDKGAAFAIHTRRAHEPDRAYRELKPVAAEIAQRYGLHLEPGRSVLEVRASSGNKGEALLGLVKELGVTAVAMCGDDLGDVSAFETLRSLRVKSWVTCNVVSASPEQPSLAVFADVLADGPVGVAAWLDEIANAAIKPK